MIDEDGDGRFDYGRDRTLPNTSGNLLDPPEIIRVGCAGRGFNPLSTSANDADGDGYLDSEDSTPTYFDPCGNQDPDGDSVPATMDNCPETHNPAQADTDDDGVGDACDNCVTVPNPEQDDGELHPNGFYVAGDGVGDACDNCPNVLNPGQENCNAAAELAAGLPLVGDACDPDVDGDGLTDVCQDNCPDVANPAQSNCNVDAEIAAGVWPVGDACDATPCATFGPYTYRETLGPGSYRVRTSGLRAQALALDYGGVAGRGSARTGMRECRCAAASEDTVDARTDCVEPPPIGNHCSRDAFDYGSGSSGWSALTSFFLFDETDVGPVGSPEFVLRYGETPAERDARDGAPILGHFDNGAANYVLWAHAISYEPVPPSDPFGCVAAGTCPPLNRALSSHYWSGTLSHAEYFFQGLGPIEWFDSSVLFPGGACLICERMFPLPHVGVSCAPGIDACLRFGRAGPEDVVLDAELEAATEGLLPELTPLIAGGDPIAWTAALEPPARLEDTAITLVGAGQDDFFAVLRDEAGVPVVRETPDYAMGPVPPDGARFLVGNRRAIGTVFGGGEFMIRWVDLDRPFIPRVQYLHGTAPLTVVALALSVQDQLVLLDTDGSIYRLMVIDLRTGASEVVEELQPGEHDSLALVGTEDGRFGLLAWSDGAGGYTLTSFSLSRPPSGWQVSVHTRVEGTETPLGDLRASTPGFSLTVEDATLGWVPVGIHFDAMEDAGGSSLQSAL